MIQIKTTEQIDLMRQGGRILAETLWEVLSAVKPGISELELDYLAQDLIREKGAEPGFKKVKGYNHTICVSTNDVVVHGIPGQYRLKEADIIGIDCGVYFKGFHTDMAESIQVKNPFGPSSGRGKKSKIKNDKDRFLDIGKRALEEAIDVARAGNRIGHISKMIQDIVEREGGYSVVRALVGHGVGKNLHEEPEVPGFLREDIVETSQLQPGMVIAIEVIYNQGRKEVVYKNQDGWTISTKDRSLSGLFERTVAITTKDPIVLTRWV